MVVDYFDLLFTDISQQLDGEMEEVEEVHGEEGPVHVEEESRPTIEKSVGATKNSIKTTGQQDSILQIERERLVVEEK